MTPAALLNVRTGATVSLGAIAFAPGAIDMYGRWMEAEGYYGHGPLVPLASAWLVWRERARLAGMPPGSSLLGLPIVVGAILLQVVSVVLDVHFTQNFSLVAAVFGAALVLLGTAIVRTIWFPLLYLAFMVPLPQSTIANLTFELKMLAARLSVKAIQLWGTPALLQGSTIHLPSTSLTVDDVCSGLRTLFALVALGAVFAWLEATRWKALLTMALTVPIAIIANVVRILVLTTLAVFEIPAPPGTWQHEAAGLVVYAAALTLLMGVRSLPGGVSEEVAEGSGAPQGAAAAEGAPPDEGSAATVAPAPGASGLERAPGKLVTAVLLGTLALGAAASVHWGFRPPVVQHTKRTGSIPRDVAGWTGTDIPITPRAEILLGTSDLLMRRYASPRQRQPVDLYVVHADDSRKVAHPPEICFAGAGYTARESGVAPLPGAQRPIRANRFIMDLDGHTELVYYWFRFGGSDTPGYLESQLSLLWKRMRGENREGTMIRITTPLGHGEKLEAAEARIAAFAREALGGAMGGMP